MTPQPGTTPSLSFDCPFCPARPGEYCVEGDGSPRDSAHDERRAFKTDVALSRPEANQ